jgi:signal transduction histidine kinase
MRISGERLAFFIGMILLITPSDKANSWAGALQAGTGETVRVAPLLRDGMKMLREHEFRVVVYDEQYIEAIALGAESLLAQCGSAVPLGINLSITRMERVLREVTAALKRSQAEKLKAQKAAVENLRSELNGALTGILLSADLALDAGPLPPTAQEKLHSIRELVHDVRRQLDDKAASGTRLRH